MRDWLNSVLVFIGSTSLTDLEYAGIDQTGMVTLTYNQAAYDQLAAVLLERESISTMQTRLVGLFTAKGVDVDEIEVAATNIYIGDVL